MTENLTYDYKMIALSSTVDFRDRLCHFGSQGYRCLAAPVWQAGSSCWTVTMEKVIYNEA